MSLVNKRNKFYICKYTQNSNTIEAFLQKSKKKNADTFFGNIFHIFMLKKENGKTKSTRWFVILLNIF